MRLQGEFTVHREPAVVTEFLADMNRLGPCIPDLQELEVSSPGEATVKVKAGIGVVRGAMTLRLSVNRAANQVQFQGKGSGMGSAVALSAGFDVSPADGGAAVAWHGEARVTGMIASMSGGLLDQVARRTVKEMMDRVETALRDVHPSADPT